MNVKVGATIIGCAVLAVASCKGSPEPRVGQTVTTGAQMLMNDDAAMRLTNARCQRESSCDNIGDARRFSDPDACRRSLFAETQATVSPQACPSGVDEAKLSLCLASVRNQPCDEQGASPEDAPACRRNELCETP
jgi:hypothetical protein